LHPRRGELLSYTSGPTLGNVESGVLDSLAGLRTAVLSGGILRVLGAAATGVALPALRHYDATSGRQLRAAGSSADS
jgi:hypothetical protein